LEGKWGVRAHQTQEMKGKEGSGDQEGREAKSGLASSGRGLATSGEKGFFAAEGIFKINAGGLRKPLCNGMCSMDFQSTVSILFGFQYPLTSDHVPSRWFVDNVESVILL